MTLPALLRPGWPEPPDAVPLRVLGLGVDHRPSRELVKHAFRAKVMAAHPDLRPELWDTNDAADVQELVWARNVLLRKIPPPVTAENVQRRESFNRNGKWWCKICEGERRRPTGERFRRCNRGRWWGYCRMCAFDAERARQRELRARVSEQRAQARADRECQTCGAVFTPKRVDGRHCSNACRQAAYRSRQKAATA